MIPFDALVVLDTNILIHVARANAFGKQIQADQKLLERVERPIISRVTVGECLSFARYQDWGADKVRRLNDLLREATILDIAATPIVEAYAELDCYSTKAGHKMGKNDAWIAATTVAVHAASRTGAWLLTTDGDFNHLSPDRLNLEHVPMVTIASAKE